ncbi:protein DA1-like isoform X10 [Phoenix dactylifera]|uniref:Protein DA1-like isoform X10 n=1 Tax=Phoenix dactylifera TaxID=42345 RepID=A0A8B9AXK1_PHODC|nr:protein DA1-like isoform X10 [Phoenix dactylifera]
MEGHHHMLETRSLCLSEEQTISNILKANSCGKSNFEHENSSIEVDSDVKLRQFLFYMVFPGSILAHELMYKRVCLKEKTYTGRFFVHAL